MKTTSFANPLAALSPLSPAEKARPAAARPESSSGARSSQALPANQLRVEAMAELKRERRLETVAYGLIYAAGVVGIILFLIGR